MHFNSINKASNRSKTAYLKQRRLDSTKMSSIKLLLRCCVFSVLLCLFQNADVSGKKKSTSFDCGPEKLCRCYNFTLRMMCDIRGFTTFDVDRAKNWSWVEHLNLEQNYFQSVPDLSMFTNLKILILARNPRISTLEENSFEGLQNLELLDMTALNMTFENGTIHEQTLKPLRKLRILRIKQEGPISAQDDYSFLLPVKDTIEQLFMVANSNLREVLDESFPRLRILSLGGQYCNLTGFATKGFTNIQKLPLTKLSLRNCNISSVPVDFFRPLARSLERLDISCNPIHEGLLNITQGLMGGKLTVLVADYINHKAIPCYWNMTSEYILQTLEVVSLRANHINYFVRAGNGSEFMKGLKYFDISRNPLNGAAFDIFTFKCTDWFWCDQTIPHQLQFFGINGITHTGSQTCGDTPDYFSCSDDSRLLLSDKTPLFEHVRHPEYLDDVILKKFFEETNATILTDATTYINSSFNMSSLPSKSILRLLIESMLQHPKSGVTISDVTNMIVRAGSSTKSFRALTAYFCTEHAMRVIYEDTMKKWASFQKTSSYAWTDRQTHFTINYICKPEWQYGVSFLADERFHFIYTNLTTVQALRNKLEILSVPNQYCNNAVYFLNNLRRIDLSYSYVPYIACSNITGLDSIYRIKCTRCNNNGWDFNGEDLPGLRELEWQENNIGKLVQEGNIFKGFKDLAWIDLSKQSPPINHFKRNDTFSDQQLTLSVLVLDECGIEIWNTSLANHVRLTQVSLRDNVIRFIHEEYRRDLERVYNKVHSSSPFQVRLEGNPINCSCNPNNLKFINWLNSAKVIYDRAKVKCADMTLVSSFPEKCSISEGGWLTWKKIAVSSTAAVVVLIVIFILMGRQIRRNRRAGYERLQMDNLPTVFISFTDRMMEDVNALKTMTQDRLILLSSSWDFSDGGLISGNLSRIIADKQKFILVVSEDYFTESNTSTEFNLLKQAGLLNRETVVLILTSSNIFGNQLPAVLQEMFNDGNFLVWPTGLCSCASVELQEICQKIIKKILP